VLRHDDAGMASPVAGVRGDTLRSSENRAFA